jgi:hypothetical protein
VQEAQFDAAVARASAAVVVTGNGDHSHAEEMALMYKNDSFDDKITIRKEKKTLTSEQATITTTIEKKGENGDKNE